MMREQSICDVDEIKRLPSEWLPLFKGLSRSVESAELWYREQTSSHYETAPLWHILVNSLLTLDPVIIDNALSFKPRLTLLPRLIQERFLNFLLRQCRVIPDAVIREIIDGVAEHVMTEQTEGDITAEFTDTVQALIKQLAKKSDDIQDKEPTSQNNSPEAIRVTETLELKDNKEAEDILIVILDDDSEDDQPAAKRQKLEPDITPNSPSPRSDQPVAMEEEDNGGCLATDRMSLSQLASSQRLSVSFLEEPEEAGKISVAPDGYEAMCCAVKDMWTNGVDNDGTASPEQLADITQFSLKDMEKFCKFIDFDSMSDDSVELACRHVCGLVESPSYSNVVCFLGSALSSRMNDVSQNASRKLSGAVTVAAQTFPKQFTDSVLVPCLFLPTVSSGQSEVMCKVAKDCFNNSTRGYALVALLKNKLQVSESKLPFLQAIIESGCELTQLDMSAFLSALNAQAQTMVKNLKFSKLLLAIVSSNEALIGKVLPEFEAILDTHQTFLKKKIVASVAKLKK